MVPYTSLTTCSSTTTKNTRAKKSWFLDPETYLNMPSKRP
jgi:hypothetical protein